MTTTRQVAGNIQVTGATMLVLGYVLDVLVTLQAMTITQDASQHWTIGIEPALASRELALLALMLVFGGWATFLGGYIAKVVLKRQQRSSRSRTPLTNRTRLTFRHLWLSLGWTCVAYFGGLLAWFLGGRDLLPTSWTEFAGSQALIGVLLQVMAIVIIPLYYRRQLAEIGLCRPVVSVKSVLYVGMFFIFMYALSILTLVAGEGLGIDTNSYREQHISEELHASAAVGLLGTLLPLLTTGLIAPIGEELLFRGVIQSTITARWGATAGVLLSAFLFAFIHADLVLFLPIFAMGILFAVLYRLTGSIWAPIWLHMVNNLWASLMDLFG